MGRGGGVGRAGGWADGWECRSCRWVRRRRRAGSRARDAAARRTIRGVNLALRIILLLWVFGYLFASCSPILGGHLIGGAIALAGGIILFIPWVIGIVVLAVLIRVTDPPRR